MPQNTERSTIEVSLSGPANWDSWDHQFKIKAVTAHLWEHIDQEEPLLKKPKMLLIGSYQRQANTRAQAAERAQTSKQSQTLEPDDDDQVHVSRLTDWAHAALQLDMQFYTQQEKEFREQDSAVQKLKKWVTNMVAPHYVEITCGAMSPWPSGMVT